MNEELQLKKQQIMGQEPWTEVLMDTCMMAR